MTRSHNLVIVGGGVAGIDVATSMGRIWRGNPALTVTLLDRSASHIWKPMLHNIAAGTRDISQQQTPFVAHAAEAGFFYQPGAMCGLDVKERQVWVEPVRAPDGRLLLPARRIPYDTLVLALGSEANDFRTEGVAEHCWKIDSLEQASAFNDEVRIRLFQCLLQDTHLHIAIVGGGATGVEFAAELVQLSQIAEAYGAVGLGRRVSVTLIESGDRLLSSFPVEISAQAKHRLESLGIRVMTSSGVKMAHADGFLLTDGTEVPASLRVWAAGIKGADFLPGIEGLKSSSSNRLQVRPTLQVVGDDRIYAIGDCASFVPEGATHPLPPTAQVASQQARYLAKYLPDVLAGRGKVPSFAYRNMGSLVSLGDYNAYGSLGKFGLFNGLTIRGRLAHFSHALLYRKHQSRIHGFWRGGLLWLVDILNKGLRARIRLH